MKKNDSEKYLSTDPGKVYFIDNSGEYMERCDHNWLPAVYKKEPNGDFRVTHVYCSKCLAQRKR